MTNASGRRTILVIDDDPLFRSLMVSLLRKDYTVLVASEGSEGYYKAIENLPDVVVVDVQMPGWDGLKTLKAFQAHRALARVPVMMLTSDASKETVLTAISAGAIEYVIKASFSKEEFLHKLQQLLDHTQPATVEKGSEDQPLAALEVDQQQNVTATSHSSTPHLSSGSTSPAQQTGEMSDQPPETANADLQEIIDSWE